MGLYERLLQEAAQLPEDPNRERNERMLTYLRNLRRPIPEGGGYVTKEELEEKQERYVREVRSLCSLLINSLLVTWKEGTGWAASSASTLPSIPT